MFLHDRRTIGIRSDIQHGNRIISVQSTQSGDMFSSMKIMLQIVMS